MRYNILVLFVTITIASCDRSEVYIVNMDECLKNITLKPKFISAAGIDWCRDSLLSDCQTLNFAMNGSHGEKMKVRMMGFRGGVFENPYGVDFKIALVDYDNNGRYNDLDIDRLFVVPHNTDSLLTHIAGLDHIVGNHVNIKVDDKNFKLIKISDDGLEVELMVVNDSSTLGDVIDFSFDISKYAFKETFTERVIEGKDLAIKGKKTYLYYYSNTCTPCLKAIPKLNELNALSDDIAVRLVAHGQRLAIEKNRSFLNKLGVDEDAIIPLDVDFFREFEFYAYSDGVLFDKQGQVEKVHVNPDNILREYQ
ncbi:hypothetical protein [Reichenbachiella sp. MSK19-1]|uniref:TlpA family protein disulfide reductase n=1 Tax=Reichenbachiella sp. MSK19-1 TaxID=1897631 RepID=UPI000E6D0569|nr:hypothetical protein [Reichenbachiella sp. MSK19-1]